MGYGYYGDGDQYRREYEAERSRNSALQRENDELERRVRDLTRKVDDLEYDLRHAQDDKERAERKLRDQTYRYERELDGLREELDSTREERDAFDRNQAVAAEEIKLLNARVAELEQQNGKLKNDLAAWRRMADEINAEWPGILDAGDNVLPNPAKGLPR